MENPQDGDGYSDHRDCQREQYQKQGNVAHNVQILPLVVKTMSNSKQDAALQPVEEALALLRSAPVLGGDGQGKRRDPAGSGSGKPPGDVINPLMCAVSGRTVAARIKTSLHGFPFFIDSSRA